MGTTVDWEARYAALLAEIAAEFPRFRLIRKDRSLLQRSIGVALAVLTFGGQRRYLEDFVTTLGSRIYVPADWDARRPEDRWATMRHERVHLDQFRRWGMPAMAVGYLLVPLPLGLAWCRMRIEAEAYAETLRAIAEHSGRAAAGDPLLRRNIISMFTGGAYGWMWPFPRAMARWYDAVLATLPP